MKIKSTDPSRQIYVYLLNKRTDRDRVTWIVIS